MMTDIPVPPGSASGQPAQPSPRSEEEIEKLEHLHTLLIDTIAGYDKVLEKAEPEFVGTAEAFRGLHVTQVERVGRMLRDLGGEIDAQGSFFGTINRSVVEMRSWFDDIGHNILGALVDGEKRVVDSFEDVILVSPSVERRGEMERMQGEIKLLLHRHASDEL